MRESLPTGFSPALRSANCLPIISVLFVVLAKMNLKNTGRRKEFFPAKSNP